MSKDNCEVCEAAGFKYRCPKCASRSCSLPCFKSHQVHCDGAGIKSNDKAEAAEPAVAISKPVMTTEQEIVHLFTQYPQLRSRLKAIYEETLDPAGRKDVEQRPRNPRFEYKWTEQKGFDRAMKVLKAKLDSDTVDSHDLEAFIAWVTRRSEEA